MKTLFGGFCWSRSLERSHDFLHDDIVWWFVASNCATASQHPCCNILLLLGVSMIRQHLLRTKYYFQKLCHLHESHEHDHVDVGQSRRHLGIPFANRDH